jgi:hypothetical protein
VNTEISLIQEDLEDLRNLPIQNITDENDAISSNLNESNNIDDNLIENTTDTNKDFEDSDHNEYNLEDNGSALFNERDLIIGLDEDDNGVKIPRFNCACHKCNVAIRKAIKKCPMLVRDLANVTSFASSINKSNLKAEIFNILKCRLRCENITRWSSSFLMLHAYYRAYKRGSFNGKLLHELEK